MRPTPHSDCSFKPLCSYDMNIIVSLSLFPLDPGFRNCPEDIILRKGNPEASRKQPIERLPAHSTGNSCSFERVWKVRTDSPARCRQRRSSPRPEQFVLLCSVDRGRILLIVVMPVLTSQFLCSSQYFCLSVFLFAFSVVWGEYSPRNIILVSCCRLFKSSSRGEELGREALRETWSRSAALLSSTPEALLFHLVLPRFSCIQTYTLLFIYTIGGFKNNVNSPVGTRAVPARNRGQKGQSHRR